jgi:hypothetical protein
MIGKCLFSDVGSASNAFRWRVTRPADLAHTVDEWCDIAEIEAASRL